MHRDRGAPTCRIGACRFRHGFFCNLVATNISEKITSDQSVANTALDEKCLPDGNHMIPL
jgi:hypothetical protein